MIHLPPGLPHPDQKWGCISYAQHGDDFVILNLFALLGVDRPGYLDVGAHHPSVISNTKLLYDRGSRGINVEANSLLMEAFCKERPGDVNLNIGVGPVKGGMTFYKYSSTSGRNTFSPAEVQSLEGILTVRETVLLPVDTINNIVQTWCPLGWPELLTIDIEGLDYAVLQTADFSTTAPLVICVETRRHEADRMEKLMADKGFASHCRMGENLFFVRGDRYGDVL